MIKSPNKIFRLLGVVGILSSIVQPYAGAASAADDTASASAKEWAGKAYKANTAGKYDEAILCADKAIQMKPDYADAYNARGLARYNSSNDKDQLEKAIKDFGMAVKLQPDFPAAYMNRGNAKDSLGLYDSAIEDQNVALRLSPDNAQAYANRGGTYHKKKLYDLAVVDYSRSLEIRPDYSHVHSKRGDSYYRKGDYDLAIQDYDKAIQLDSNVAYTYRVRARAYLKKGAHDKVIADCNRSLEIAPDSAVAYNLMGDAYLGKGDYDLAAENMKKAVLLDPKNDEFKQKLANLQGKTAVEGPSGRVGVAVYAIGRAMTDGERALRNYLGQEQGINYILVPYDAREFFGQLAHITQDGRKINYLIILGHGSADPPHIALWKGGDLRTENFDLEIIKAAIQRSLELIERAKKELCEIRFKSGKSSEDLDRERFLENTIQNNTKELERQKESLRNLEKIQGIMSENACILLLNCSAAATDEGVKFVKAIGKAFLGNAGGQITASKRDIEIYQMSPDNPGSIGFIQGFGKWIRATFYHGKFVRPGDYYITAQGPDWLNMNWITSDVPVQGQEKPFYLPVAFENYCIEAEQDGEVTLNASADPYEDSGAITYFWNFGFQGTIESSYTLDTSEYLPGKITKVSVLARDSRAREGKDTAYVLIKKPERAIELNLSDDKPEAGSTITATAKLSKGQAPKDSMWVWQSGGGLEIVAKHEEEAEVKVSNKGVLTVQLEYIGPFGKVHILAEKSVTIKPAGIEATAPKKRAEKDKAGQVGFVPDPAQPAQTPETPQTPPSSGQAGDASPVKAKESAGAKAKGYTADPIWVLKTTETKITKDPDNSDFFNNQMNMQGTSASGSTTMRDG